MKNYPNPNIFKEDSNVVSSTDCTGLIPSDVTTEDELEEYADMRNVLRKEDLK